MLDLAGHHDLRADRQPALDEAATEPCRVDAAGVEDGDTAMVDYEYFKKPHGLDTEIKVYTSSSDELWRRIQLTDLSGGVKVRVFFTPWELEIGDGVQSSRTFPGTSTLGDLSVWLSDEAAGFPEPPKGRSAWDSGIPVEDE